VGIEASVEASINAIIEVMSIEALMRPSTKYPSEED
jgi:hypothetical protein